MRAFVVLSFVFAQSVAAQQQDTVKLRPVEVRVTRTSATDLKVAAPVTTITRTEIQGAQMTVGLDEALAVVPGVVVNNRYNFALGSRISIRGLGSRAAFGVRGIRLMVDGIPLTMPDGQANVNNIDLGSAGRIEVLRGPSSSLYGNAAGGVISIETEPAPARTLATEVTALRSDLGRDKLDRLEKYQVKLGGTAGRFDYLVSGAAVETDGYRDHSRAEQSNINGRLRMRAGDASHFTLLFNHADAPTAQNPGSLPLDSAEQRPTIAWPNNVRQGTGEAARQTQGGLRFEHRGSRSHFDVSAYGLTRSLTNPVPTAYITLDRSAGGARAAFNRWATLGGRALELTVGSDVELQRDERFERNNAQGQPGSTTLRDQEDRVLSVGPFAQGEVALTSALRLTAGLRADWLKFESEDRFTRDRDDSGERTLSALSPRIALAYSPTERLTVYAAGSTAFQTPTITELINTPPPAGSTAIPGGFNPNLDPQRAVNFEVGVKGQLRERVRYEASIYQLTLKDALVPFQIAGIAERSFFRNSGETRNRGLEVAGTARLLPRLLLDASYTFNDFVFIDDGLTDRNFEGNDVPGVPKHHLFARVRWHAVESLVIEAENDYTSKFFTNDENSVENEAANVVDVRASFDFPFGQASARPFVGVNNIFDQRYNSSVVINAAGNPGRYFEPAPGRNLYVGVTLTRGWHSR